MSNFIPMVSSSPPPMDDTGGFDDWGDNDDFGDFTSADTDSHSHTATDHWTSKPDNDGWSDPVSSSISKQAKVKDTISDDEDMFESTNNFSDQDNQEDLVNGQDNAVIDTSLSRKNKVGGLDIKPVSEDDIEVTKDVCTDKTSHHSVENVSGSSMTDSGLYSNDISPVPQSDLSEPGVKGQASDTDSMKDLVIESSLTESGIECKTADHNSKSLSVEDETKSESSVDDVVADTVDISAHKVTEAVIGETEDNKTSVNMMDSSDASCPNIDSSSLESKPNDIGGDITIPAESESSHSTSSNVIPATQTDADHVSLSAPDVKQSELEQGGDSAQQLTDSVDEHSVPANDNSERSGEDLSVLPMEDTVSDLKCNSEDSVLPVEGENIETSDPSSLTSADADSQAVSKHSDTDDNDGDEDFGDFSEFSKVTDTVCDETSSVATVETDTKPIDGGEDKQICEIVVTEAEDAVDQVENKETDSQKSETYSEDEDTKPPTEPKVRENVDDEDLNDFSESVPPNDLANDDDDFGDFASLSVDTVANGDKDTSQALSTEGSVEDLTFRIQAENSSRTGSPAVLASKEEIEEDVKESSSGQGTPTKSASASSDGGADNPDNEHEDDDFGDFNAPTTEVDDDFGDFSAVADEGFAAFDSAGPKTEEDGGDWASFSAPPVSSTQDVEEEDEEWAAFNDTTTETNAAKSSPPSPQRQQSGSKKDRVVSAVIGCFLASVAQSDLTSEEMKAVVEGSDSQQDKQALWNKVTAREDHDALLYHWSQSSWNKCLYSTLKIDTRNILIGHKKHSMPIFASNLTLLEPTKGGTTPTPPVGGPTLIDTSKTEAPSVYSSTQIKQSTRKLKNARIYPPGPV